MKHNHIVQILQLLLTIIVSATMLFKLFNGVIEVHQCEAARTYEAFAYYMGQNLDNSTNYIRHGRVTGKSDDTYICLFMNDIFATNDYHVTFYRTSYNGKYVNPIVKDILGQFSLLAEYEIEADDVLNRVWRQDWEFIGRGSSTSPNPSFCFPHSTSQTFTGSFTAIIKLTEVTKMEEPVDYTVIYS